MTQAAPPAVTVPPRDASRPRIFYGWWIVAAAIVAQFVAIGTIGQVNGVFLEPMTDELGWTRAEFTIATSVGTVLFGVAAFFIGVQVDRRGARPLMVAGATVAGATLIAFSRVEELWQFVLLRGLVFTMGAALIGNLVVNVTVSKWFVERRGWAISMASLGVSAAAIVAPVVMTRVVDTLGWRDGWVVLGLVTWVLVYPAALVMRRQPEDHGQLPDGRDPADTTSERGRRATEAAALDLANSYTRGEAVRTSSLWLLIAAFGLAGVGLISLFFHFIPFLTDAGYTRTQASLFVGTQGVAALVSKFAWGWAMQRFFARGLAAVSFLVSGASTAGIVVVAQTGELLPMYALFLVWGWGVGGMIPLTELIWASYFGRRELGAVRGVGMPVTFGLNAAGPFFAGAYFDLVGSYDGALLTFATFWGVAALLVLVARRPGPPPRARAAVAASIPSGGIRPAALVPLPPAVPAPLREAPLDAAAETEAASAPAGAEEFEPTRVAADPPEVVAQLEVGAEREPESEIEPEPEPQPEPEIGVEPEPPRSYGLIDGAEQIEAPPALEPPAAPPPAASPREPPPPVLPPSQPPVHGAPPRIEHRSRAVQQRLPLALERYRRDDLASAVAIGVAASVAATAAMWLVMRAGKRGP